MKKSNAQKHAEAELNRMVANACNPDIPFDDLTAQALVRKIAAMRALNRAETPVDMFAEMHHNFAAVTTSMNQRKLI